MLCYSRVGFCLATRFVRCHRNEHFYAMVEEAREGGSKAPTDYETKTETSPKFCTKRPNFRRFRGSGKSKSIFVLTLLDIACFSLATSFLYSSDLGNMPILTVLLKPKPENKHVSVSAMNIANRAQGDP